MSLFIPAIVVRRSNCWTVENHSGTSLRNASKVVLQFRHLLSKLFEGRVAVSANGIQTLRRMNIIPAGTFQTLRRMNIIPARIEKLLESRVAVQASGIQTLGRSNIIPEPIVQTLRRSSCSSWCCCLNYWKVVMQFLKVSSKLLDGRILFRHELSKLINGRVAVPESGILTFGRHSNVHAEKNILI